MPLKKRGAVYASSPTSPIVIGHNNGEGGATPACGSRCPGGEPSIENFGVGQANVLKEIGKSSEIFPKAKDCSDLHSVGDIDSKRL